MAVIFISWATLLRGGEKNVARRVVKPCGSFNAAGKLNVHISPPAFISCMTRPPVCTHHPNLMPVCQKKKKNVTNSFSPPQPLVSHLRFSRCIIHNGALSGRLRPLRSRYFPGEWGTRDAGGGELPIRTKTSRRGAAPTFILRVIP